MAQAFITGKEESLVLLDWPADISAKLVALEWSNRIGSAGGCCNAVEGIARVKKVIAQIVIHFAVERVRPGPGGNVHNGPGVTTVFCAISGVVNLKFGDGVDRRLESNLVLHHVTQINAVDHEVDCIFAVAVSV